MAAPAIHQTSPQITALRPAETSVAAAIEAQIQPYPWNQAQFMSASTLPYLTFGLRLATAPQSLIGYMVLLQMVDEMHLLRLGISPAHQGQGCAGHIWRAACDQFRQPTTINSIWLEVAQKNTHAQQIYQHWGFEVIARRPNYYHAANGYDDALVMRLTWPQP